MSSADLIEAQKVWEDDCLGFMEVVRKLDHLGQCLRKKIGIPLRQPLLDFAFGGKEGFLPISEYIDILAESLNIWSVGDTTYYRNRDFHHGYDIVPPDRDEWVKIEEDGMWLALDTTMPDWLSEIGKKRKEERQAIFARQRQN